VIGEHNAVGLDGQYPTRLDGDDGVGGRTHDDQAPATTLRQKKKALLAQGFDDTTI
jgi:hypothetical protein